MRLQEKKIRNVAAREASTWWYMENVTSIISLSVGSEIIDMAFSIYRHVKAVRATTFPIFS